MQAPACPHYWQMPFDSTPTRSIKRATHTGISKAAVVSCIKKARPSPAASQKRRSGNLLVADMRSLAAIPCLRVALLHVIRKDCVMLVKYGDFFPQSRLELCAVLDLQSYPEAR